MTEPSAAPTGLFHGWWIVVAGFISTLLALGSTTYTFGLFVAPMAEEFGLSRADANGGFIFLLLGFALWAPIVGRLMDRLPARTVMSVGAISFGAGFFVIALAPAPWMMALAILLPVAFGTVSCGALAANTVTSRWFRRLRGRAMGLLAVSTSAGGFTMPPLVAFLMETYGWRTALMIQGTLVAVIALLVVLWLIRDKPADLGLQHDGDAAEPPQATSQGAPTAPPSESIWRYGPLLRNANFWLLACGAGILLGADQALLATMVPYGLDAGFTAAQAALLMSSLTFSAIIGKLIIGALADRVDKRWLFCAVAACNFSFLIVLMSGPSYPVLMLACGIIGLAIGGTYPLWMTLTADCFGSASFGSVMGAMNLVVMPFSIVAIRFIGEVFDRTGGYNPAFMVFICTAVVSALLVLMVKPSPSQRVQSDVAGSS
jgi:sugar phosphate permease